MDWCQGITTLTDETGAISDGSFNFNYKNRTSCRWKILPESGGAVILTLNHFQTEPVNDNLRIYDYGTEELLGEVSGMYTNGDMPGPFTASSGKMFLIWNTNSSVTAPGWDAYYSTYPAGVSGLSLSEAVSVFPNPANDYLSIRITDARLSRLNIELQSLAGKTVLKELLSNPGGSAEKKISIASLPAGLYLLRLYNDRETTYRKVIIY